MPSGREPVRPPSYAFTDRSLVRPLLTRVWFAPLFRLVPGWLAANLVTLMSFGSLLLALALTLAAVLPPAGLALALLALQLVYVAGDHLDGMQAVASGTTSPLGDFLDHYCDLWAGAILALAFWVLVEEAPPAVLYVVEGLLILGFAVTYVEREERRALHFTSLGALEGNLLLAGFILSWTAAPVRAWWRAAGPFGVPRYWGFVAVGALIASGVVGVIARRMRRVPWTLLVFGASLGALATLLATRTDVPAVAGWTLLGLLGAGYVGRVMRGYLLTGHRSAPDLVAAAAIAGLAAWNALGDPSPAALRVGAWVLAAWLLAAAAWSLTDILRSLRRHWMWTNRRPESALQKA